MGAERIVVLASVSAATIVAPTSNAETRRHYGGPTLVASLLSRPHTLDPLHARSHADLTVAGLMYDALYRVDRHGRVRPHLALELPSFSPDGRSATIKVRQGVLFHNGKTLTSRDVVQSLRRSASTVSWLLAPVRKVEARAEGVTITLHRQAPELARLLASTLAAITHRGVGPKTADLGSGPFALRWVDDSRRRMLLKPFGRHFAGAPFVRAVELRWFTDPDAEARSYEAGNIHMSLRGAVAFAGHQPKYATSVVNGQTSVLVYVGFGRSHRALLARSEFRQALSHAISRESLATINSGEPISPSMYPLAPTLGGRSAGASSLRARRSPAKRFLDRAFARSGVDRATLGSLEILVDATRPDDREIAGKLVNALFHLGVSAFVSALPARDFMSRRRSGRCDLYIDQLGTVSSDRTVANGGGLCRRRRCPLGLESSAQHDTVP